MFKTIVCPLDLSERSFKALAKAAEIARLCNSHLILLHLVEKFMSEKEMIMLRVGAEHFQEVQREIALKVKKQIQDEITRLKINDLEPEIILREGNPRRDIDNIAAELNADLIVISSSGKGFISEAVIGSTAEALLRQAKIDVLRVYLPK